MDNPMVLAPLPGEKLSFGELSIQFLIDEDMSNYVAIHDWMVGLGFPESHEQYRNFMSNRLGALATNELSAAYSDAVLEILNSSNNPIRTISFVDVFPTSMSTVTLQSTTSDTQYLAANATFRYTFYRFE